MKLSQLEQLPDSPMWVQYRSIKKDALDALLFYRMGDFYELFLDDAVDAAGILGITLTARNKNEGVPIPMCGVPFHSATNYITRLLTAGKRVAICEQTEESGATKGIVKREIVRVVSPGMAFDSDALDSGQNNFLVVLHPGELVGTGAYCATDITTGSLEFSTYSTFEQLRDDLSLIRAREVAAASSLIDTADWNTLVKEVGPEFFPCLTPSPDFYFSAAQGAAELCRHFNVLNLEGFGLPADHPALGAVGATFRIIRDSQKQGDLRHLQPPTPRLREGFLQLDETTIEHLDLFPKPGQNPAESVFHHLDRTSTAMGARKLRELLSRPLGAIAPIRARQNAVVELKSNSSLLRRLREELGGIRDLERLTAKIGLRTALPRDLQALQQVFQRLPAIKETLKEAKSPLLLTLESGISPFEELHSYLATRLRDELPANVREGNIFRAGWNTELDELIALTEDGQKVLLEMEERERAATGITSLKIKYNRVFGYFIEVTTSNLANVPAHYIRKQTTANGERYLTDELKKFEEKILSAQDKRIALEDSLFQKALAHVGERSQEILGTARELALLDALASLATAAVEHGFEAPEIVEENVLEIEQGRHPALEKLVGRDKFIANDAQFTAKERAFLITGPNMAGKSTFMRQVAIISLLAHTGSLVPARSARVGLIDRIATRVGASDRIGRGQSTFMVEMNELARILRQSSARSLLIIDEIGRGTSTFDGLALAWAILEDIIERLACRALFATHYHELTQLESRFSSVKNLSVVVEERNGEVVFLHEVRRGKAPGSYGIEVAKLAGLPHPVVERAKDVLSLLEKGSAKLQKSQKEALSKDIQMNFFGSAATRTEKPVPEHLVRLETALRAFDINQSSPLHALQTLKTWKDQLETQRQ
ncbi:MAG: DNA mismatch repair protein MutS [Bdellovibrionota bacterium]